jgi:hypothetical protein
MNKIICLLGLLLSSQIESAQAAILDLSMGPSGSILPIPIWANSADVQIASLSFVFSGLAGSTAGVSVDSSAASLKLLNATSYPASAAITLPTGCTIGATAVANADVQFLQSGTVVTTSVLFSSGSLNSFSLRFAAAGAYGTRSGLINCSSSGHLIYTY